MANKDQYTAKQFIDAIKGSGAIKTAIASRVGCTVKTFEKYLRDYPTVNTAYEAEKEASLDVAESVVKTNIKFARKQQKLLEQQQEYMTVDSSDAKWFLSKKGKNRGFGDKTEVELSGEVDVKEKRLDLSRLSEDDLREYIRIVRLIQYDDS